MGDSVQQDTESEGYARRGYTPDESLALLSDALMYEPDGKYFHTVDNRFAQVWMLGMVDRSVLGPKGMVAASQDISRIMAQYPFGSSGQLCRITHRGIQNTLTSFVGNGSQHPFGNDILMSIAQRQQSAAMGEKGFFTNISKRMVEKAKEDLRREIDEEDRREAAFELIERSTDTGAYPYMSELYLVFIWTPPTSLLDRLAKIQKLIMAGLKLADMEVEAQKVYMAQRRAFLQHATAIERTAAQSCFQIGRITGQGMIDVLYRLLNPVRTHEVRPPKWRPGYTIGDLLSKEPSPESQKQSIREKVGFQPVIPERNGFKWPYRQGGETGYYYGRITTVGGLPSKLSPGTLQDALALNEGEALVTMNFSITPKAVVWARLATREKAISLAGNVKGTGSEVHQRQVADLAAVKNATAADNVYNRQRMMDAGIYCSFFGFNQAKVEERAELAQGALFDEGIVELTRGDAMMHHSFPLNYRPSARALIRREQPLLSSHAGRLAPIFVEYQGIDSPAILVNNRAGQPIFIDLFGSQCKTAHSLVCGSTGTGKSFAFNMLLMTMVAKYRPKVWLIDKGRSYESLCYALDGGYIDLVLEAQGDLTPSCINPFFVAPDEMGRPRRPETSEKEFLTDWLISCIKASGDDVRLHQTTSNLVFRALTNFYEKWPPEKEATFSDFVEVLRVTDFTEVKGQTLCEQLENFYGKGAYAALFDGHLDIEWDADLIVLETDRMSQSRALPVAMLALFRQIEIFVKFKLPRNRPKIIGVDEAWNTLANKEAANALGGFFRELRKYKGGVILISQSLVDFIKLVKNEGGGDSGGAEDGILINTNHYFLLACEDVDHKAAMEDLNFTQEEVNAWASVSSLPPFFSEVFYRQKLSTDRFYSGVFRIYSAPVPLWIATTDADDVELRRERVAAYIGSGLSPTEARRRSIVDLASEYPYGSRYQIDQPEKQNAA